MDSSLYVCVIIDYFCGIFVGSDIFLASHLAMSILISLAVGTHVIPKGDTLDFLYQPQQFHKISRVQHSRNIFWKTSPFVKPSRYFETPLWNGKSELETLFHEMNQIYIFLKGFKMKIPKIFCFFRWLRSLTWS